MSRLKTGNITSIVLPKSVKFSNTLRGFKIYMAGLMGV